MVTASTAGVDNPIYWLNNKNAKIIGKGHAGIYVLNSDQATKLKERR